MAGDGARAPNTADWVARLVSAVGVLGLLMAIVGVKLASEANSIARQGTTSTVIISSVGWASGPIETGIAPAPEAHRQLHADLELTFTNRGGLAVSLINAELFDRWETRSLVRTASAQSWYISRNVVKLECTHKDRPVELPFHIDPGLSQQLRFSAKWTSGPLPGKFDSELLKGVPQHLASPPVPHSLVWNFYFGNGQVLSYDSGTVSVMTNTP